MKRDALLVAALTLLLRLPFLATPVQGDDVYYLYGAQHALVDPAHPLHTEYAFMGQVVDMRGHPHGPLNAWVLGGLVVMFGEVREVPFHSAYLVFSLAAALAMLSLARRFVKERALHATLLFLAVPAFVVNGNSFETDVPFVAFWLLAFDALAKGMDNRSVVRVCLAVLACALAALTSSQAVMLTPILGLYVWLRSRTWNGGRQWLPVWAGVFAAPVTIAAWQGWEWWTSGALPLAVLTGYMRNSTWQSAGSKLASGVALTGHMGWVVFPALIFQAFRRDAARWQWVVTTAAGALALLHDPNPLFWISIASGTLLIVSTLRKEFLCSWILLFYLASLLIFFAGSARYLLPLAAPVCMAVAQALAPKWTLAGFGAQVALSLGLALVNTQHWAATRDFADAAMKDAGGRRVWVNADLSIRHYLEDRGALPLLHDSIVRPGEFVVTSELAKPVTLTLPVARVREAAIAPAVPLRLISIDGGSGFSSSSKGLLPFEISREPIDRLTLDVAIERRAELSYLDPKDARAPAHVIGGLYPDGWMSAQASVLLKVPANVKSLGVQLFIPEAAPARRIELLADGRLLGEENFAKPGAYSVFVPFSAGAAQVTVGLRVDATHTVPPDGRALGVVITGVGFRE